MLRINNIKVDVTGNPSKEEKQLQQKIAKALKVPELQGMTYQIRKRSIDARKKSEVKYIYCVDVECREEEKVLKRAKNPNITQVEKECYQFVKPGQQALKGAPVIIGAGPAGLFCGYLLAMHGYAPVIIERGQTVDKRTKTIEKFWKDNVLNEESNVQFGEGGAGTFSDGKLNTLVKEKGYRNRFVLETFVQMGADPSILYVNKPHIGTDVLRTVIENLRNRIIELGGTFYFESKMTDMEIEDGILKSITINNDRKLTTQALVLAIGHSARDTFALLKDKGLHMEPKAFAVGLRMEHPQKMISTSQYGEFAKKLEPADYKVTHTVSNGRGVYSFCMCPGGYVVNASSEEGYLAVNGMSYHDRAGENANSAIVVTVSPEDFGSENVLAGVEFQRRLEKAAYEAGEGKVPVQMLKDFEKNQKSRELKEVVPSICGQWQLANLRNIFPEEINESIIEGIHGFAKQIKEFDRKDALLSGVESRTSSPVRIVRDNETYLSNIKGVYPCGEGAGYAGGITSAAMDGIRTAEKIAMKFKRKDKI